MNLTQTIEKIDHAVFTVTQGTSIPTVTYKTCTKCLLPKVSTDFNKRQGMCKPCQCKSNQENVERYKMKNSSQEYVRPEQGWCHICKENIPSKYFSLAISRPNGLDNVCKFHKYLINLSYKKKLVDSSNPMSREQFFWLLDQTCCYCGSADRIGVDRLDSSKGYQQENCVPCCFICNGMKSDRTAEQFREHCKKVASYKP